MMDQIQIAMWKTKTTITKHVLIHHHHQNTTSKEIISGNYLELWVNPLFEYTRLGTYSETRHHQDLVRLRWGQDAFARDSRVLKS